MSKLLFLLIFNLFLITSVSAEDESDQPMTEFQKECLAKGPDSDPVYSVEEESQESYVLDQTYSKRIREVCQWKSGYLATDWVYVDDKKAPHYMIDGMFNVLESLNGGSSSNDSLSQDDGNRENSGESFVPFEPGFAPQSFEVSGQ